MEMPDDVKEELQSMYFSKATIMDLIQRVFAAQVRKSKYVHDSDKKIKDCKTTEDAFELGSLKAIFFLMEALKDIPELSSEEKVLEKTLRDLIDNFAETVEAQYESTKATKQ